MHGEGRAMRREIGIPHTNMKMDSVSLFHKYNQPAYCRLRYQPSFFHLLIAAAQGKTVPPECAAADSRSVGRPRELYSHKTGSSQGRSNWPGGRLQRWATALGKSEWMRGLRRGRSESERLALTSLPHQLQPAAWPGRNPHRRLSVAGERKLGVSEVVPGEEAPGPGPPSRGHSCGLVVQSPPWSKVPQRVWQRAPCLSFTGVTWSCTAGRGACVYVCVRRGGRGRVREGAMQLGLFVCFFFTLGSLAFEVLMSYVLVYRHVREITAQLKLSKCI